MKVSRLIVGIMALSLAAAGAQAAPSSDALAGPAGPGCICFADPAGGGVCGIGTTCATAPLCGGANPPCPAGSTCIDGSSSCCGFTHCNDDCPAGVACSNPTTCAGGLAACVSAKPEDCALAIPAPGPVTPCNDTTPTGPLGLCTSGGGRKDKWVSFVAPATSTRIRTDIGATGLEDSDIIIWDACPPAGNKIGCSEDISPGPPNYNYLSDACVGGLTVGATYYVQVGAWSDGVFYPPACAAYNVTIQAAGTCGDGTLDCGEDCDDGNFSACDGCSPGCTLESCGDGVVCPPEQCDGGGQTALCDGDCTLALCGDGTLNVTAGEQCDDGNLINGDGCSSTCRLPVCGDGNVDVGEQCDPPGSTPAACGAGGSCNSICKCIDGIPAVSEWGLAVLTLIGLVSGTILFGRRRVAVR